MNSRLIGKWRRPAGADEQHKIAKWGLSPRRWQAACGQWFAYEGWSKLGRKCHRCNRIDVRF